MEPDKNVAEALSLFPVTIIAFGAPAAPVERLIGLQSAVAKAVDWLTQIRLPRLRSASPAAPTRLSFHPTSHGDLS
jgi:hypothetical protein